MGNGDVLKITSNINAVIMAPHTKKDQIIVVFLWLYIKY